MENGKWKMENEIKSQAYSSRNTTIGPTRVARRVGTSIADSATLANKMAVMT
jgi:hypothetical protein